MLQRTQTLRKTITLLIIPSQRKSTVSALNSIKQNTKFAKLVTFALNCLMGQTYLPNNKHRDNVRYILNEEGQIVIIEVLDHHYLNDIIVQHSVCVLNRLIGIGFYRDENVAKKMIAHQIHLSLQKVSEQNLALSKESINNIIELIENMMLSQYAELATLLYGILLMVRESSVQDIRKALELVYRMADLGGDKEKICEQVNLILKQNSEDIGIIQLSLRLLAIVAVKDKLDLYLIIDIMNKHKDVGNICQIYSIYYLIYTFQYIKYQQVYIKQYIQYIQQILSNIYLYNIYIINKHLQIDIQQIGGRVLIQIAGNQDIENALQQLKLLKSDTDITLLSALIMDDKFIQEHPELALEFLELLKLNKKNKKIALSCLIGIGRAADQNEELGQKLYENDALKVCLEMLDFDDTEVVSNCIKTMEKICVITHFDSEVVTKVEKVMNSKIKEEFIVEAGLQLLISNGQGGFQSIIQKCIDNYQENREICELMSKLFFLHCNQIGEFKKLDMILKLLHDRFYWRSMCYYLIKGLNVLRESKELKKSSKKLMVYLVEILNQKSYSEKEEEQEEEQESNFKYTSELKEECVKLIQKVMTKEELQQYSVQLATKQSELLLYQIAYCVLVQELAEFYLRTDNYLKVSSLPLSQPQLFFYTNFSLLFWNLMAKDLYKKKAVTQMVLQQLVQALERGVHISQALDTLINMSGSNQSQGTIEIIINPDIFLDLKSYDSNQLFIILTNTIKKYPALATKALIAIYELLKFRPCATSCINTGTPRLIATMLDDQATTDDAAYQIIRILNFLKQQQYVMQVIQFINLHPYNLKLRNLVQEYFREYDPKQFDFQKDIKQALKKKEYQQLSAYALLPDALPEDIHDQLYEDYAESSIFITSILGCTEQDDRFVPLLLKSADKRITRNHVVHLCNTLNGYEVTLQPDDIIHFVDLLIKYEDDQEVIDLINSFLFNEETNEFLVKTRYVKRLIKLTKLYILFEFSSKQFAIRNNLNWLYMMSSSAGEAIRSQGAVTLCMAVIRHEVAFHIKRNNKQRKSFRSKLRDVPHKKESDSLVHVALKLLRNLVKCSDKLDIYKLLSLQNTTTILLALEVIEQLEEKQAELIQPLLSYPDQDVQVAASRVLYSQQSVAQLKNAVLLSESGEQIEALIKALQFFKPDEQNLELSQQIISLKKPNIQLLSLLIKEDDQNRQFIIDKNIPQQLLEGTPSRELFAFLNLCLPHPSPYEEEEQQDEIPHYKLPPNFKVPKDAVQEYNRFAAYQKYIPLEGDFDSEALTQLINQHKSEDDDDSDEEIENIIDVVQNSQYFFLKSKQNQDHVSDLTEYLIQYQYEYSNNEDLQRLLLQQLRIQQKYKPTQEVIDALKQFMQKQSPPLNESLTPTKNFEEQVILYCARLASQSKEMRKEFEDLIFEKGSPLAKLRLLQSYEKDEVDEKVLLKSDQFMVENLMIPQFQDINKKLKRWKGLEEEYQEEEKPEEIAKAVVSEQIKEEENEDEEENQNDEQEKSSPFEKIEKRESEQQQQQQPPKPLTRKSKTVDFRFDKEQVKKSGTMKESKPLDSIQERLQIMLQNGELNKLLLLEQTAWKMVQSGIVDQLLQIDPLPWEQLNILTQHPKIAKVILDPKQKLYLELINALNENPTKEVIQTAGNLPPRSLMKFGQTSQIIKAVNAEDASQRKVALLTLHKLNQNERILLKNQEEQIKLIKEQYQQISDPETIMLMNKLIEQVAHDSETQSKLREVGEVLVRNMNDRDVGASNTNALANLVFNNKENAQEVLSAVPGLMENEENDLRNPEKASAICLLYNSMAYKNEEMKQKLGEMHVIEHLIRIFCEYSKLLIIDVLEQCLRALGNLAINLTNSELIVKYMFQDFLSEFILKNSSEKSIIKLGLDVIQTVSSLIYSVTTRNYEKKYLFTMLGTDYTLKALTYCLTFTTQFEEVIVSALITLTYLLNNNEIGKQFLSYNGDQKLVRVVQQSGLNREVCYFSLKILQQLIRTNASLHIDNLHIDLAHIIKQFPDNLDLFAEVINLGLVIQTTEMEQLISQIFVFTEENEIPEEIPIIHFIYKHLKGNEAHVAQSAINYLLNYLDNLKGSSIVDKISAFPEGIQLIYQSNGVKQCVKLLQKHFTNTDLSLHVGYSFQYQHSSSKSLTTSPPSRKNIGTPSPKTTSKPSRTQRGMTMLRPSAGPSCRNSLSSSLNHSSGKAKSPMTTNSKWKRGVSSRCNMVSSYILDRYKEDGSRSYLQFFINDSLTEVNCKLKQAAFIKPKWRLPIQKIEKVFDNYHEHPKVWLASPFLNISWLAKTKNYIIQKQKLDPARAFTLIAFKGTKPKCLNAYCPSIQEKKKWVRLIKQLMEENEQLLKKLTKKK